MATNNPDPLARQETTTREPVTVELVGGPTAVLEIGGLRLVTDPTFDPPGRYPIGQRTLVKTAGPATPLTRLGRVDAVLLSHDQHPDNLDTLGRDLLGDVPLVLTTAVAADRLGGTAQHIPIWSEVYLDRPDVGVVRIVGVPAQHGPDGTEHLTGEVRGFVVSGDGLPTVYISGDNASLAVVQEVAERCGPVDVALLFAGAARTPLVDGFLTLTAEEAATAARVLDAAAVLVVHAEGWEHFTERPDAVRAAFDRAGLADQLVPLAPGERVTI